MATTPSKTKMESKKKIEKFIEKRFVCWFDGDKIAFERKTLAISTQNCTLEHFLVIENRLNQSNHIYVLLSIKFSEKEEVLSALRMGLRANNYAILSIRS